MQVPDCYHALVENVLLAMTNGTLGEAIAPKPYRSDADIDQAFHDFLTNLEGDGNIDAPFDTLYLTLLSKEVALDRDLSGDGHVRDGRFEKELADLLKGVRNPFSPN